MSDTESGKLLGMFRNGNDMFQNLASLPELKLHNRGKILTDSSGVI